MKGVASSARRSALPMTDVAAWVIYHIARANVIIGISACIGVPFSVGRNVTAALRWRISARWSR